MKRLFLLGFLIPLCCMAQHTISGTFSPKGAFSKVFLYRIAPEAPNYLEYISYTAINADGKASFNLDNSMAPGMYQLTFGAPGTAYHFDFIYNGKETIVFEYNKEDGVTFSTSKENILLQDYNNKSNEAKQLLSAVFYPTITDQAYNDVFTAIDEVQKHYETLSEGMMVHHYIVTGRSPIPEKRIGPNEYVALEKSMYFKNIDFDDPALQKSFYLINIPVLYVLKFNEGNETASYKKNVDTVMAKIGNRTAIKKQILENLWGNFVAEENMEVANYISDSYLLSLAKELNDNRLVEEIEVYKTTAIGAIAPDFNLGDGQKLSDLNSSDHYLLIFWSSTCSHCLTEIPEVKKFTDAIDPSKIQIIAFGLENEEYPWKATIKDYPEFIHVYGAGKWDNETSNTYNVTSTPTYFILDADKKIIAKPESLEELKTAIEKL